MIPGQEPRIKLQEAVDERLPHTADIPLHGETEKTGAGRLVIEWTAQPPHSFLTAPPSTEASNNRDGGPPAHPWAPVPSARNPSRRRPTNPHRSAQAQKAKPITAALRASFPPGGAYRQTALPAPLHCTGVAPDTPHRSSGEHSGYNPLAYPR